MKTSPHFLRILTTGGSVSPGDLEQIATLAQAYGHATLEVGNRQEIILPAERPVQREDLARRIKPLNMVTDEPDRLVQNVVSSLPATGICPATPWLTVGVYLDVLAQFGYQPHLSVSIIDPVQPLVPPATGNINFIAAPEPDYWFVLLRPPGSVRRYVWPVLIAGESAGAFAQVVETSYLTEKTHHPDDFYKVVMAVFGGKTRKPAHELLLPDAGVPVFEGFQSMPSGYWLGIYRKTQTFPLAFVEALCRLCQQTRIGRIYLTTNKTLLIKDIRDGDRPAWDQLLGRFGIRTNLPAWHLNWQLPNADPDAIALKNHILHQLEETDVRIDELSFAVNVPFSEASASVVIQKGRDIGPCGTGRDSPQLFDVYQRTHQTTTNVQYALVAKSHPLTQLSDVVQQLAFAYYERLTLPAPVPVPDEGSPPTKAKRLVHECPNCLSRYDAHYGEPHRGIADQTPFDALPDDYFCGLCEAEKTDFVGKWVE